MKRSNMKSNFADRDNQASYFPQSERIPLGVLVDRRSNNQTTLAPRRELLCYRSTQPCATTPLRESPQVDRLQLLGFTESSQDPAIKLKPTNMDDEFDSANLSAVGSVTRVAGPGTAFLVGVSKSGSSHSVLAQDEDDHGHKHDSDQPSRRHRARARGRDQKPWLKSNRQKFGSQAQRHAPRSLSRLQTQSNSKVEVIDLCTPPSSDMDMSHSSHKLRPSANAAGISPDYCSDTSSDDDLPPPSGLHMTHMIHTPAIEDESTGLSSVDEHSSSSKGDISSDQPANVAETITAAPTDSAETINKIVSKTKEDADYGMIARKETHRIGNHPGTAVLSAATSLTRQQDIVFVCDVCKTAEFDCYDEACRHEAACAGANTCNVKLDDHTYREASASTIFQPDQQDITCNDSDAFFTARTDPFSFDTCTADESETEPVDTCKEWVYTIASPNTGTQNVDAEGLISPMFQTAGDDWANGIASPEALDTENSFSSPLFQTSARDNNSDNGKDCQPDIMCSVSFPKQTFCHACNTSKMTLLKNDCHIDYEQDRHFEFRADQQDILSCRETDGCIDDSCDMVRDMAPIRTLRSSRLNRREDEATENSQTDIVEGSSAMSVCFAAAKMAAERSVSDFIAVKKLRGETV